MTPLSDSIQPLGVRRKVMAYIVMAYIVMAYIVMTPLSDSIQPLGDLRRRSPKSCPE
jgi:hypothetical protein